MDFQYINNLDYWSLVNMLMNQITPEIRKQILNRLIKMNDQLLIDINTQTDLSNSSVSTSRKDSLEFQYPSIDNLDYKNQNTLHLTIPTNNNNPFTGNNSFQTNSTILTNNYKNTDQFNSRLKNKTQKIEFDDIINKNHNKSDNLDEKLIKIKKLYDKIIINKKRIKEINNSVNK